MKATSIFGGVQFIQIIIQVVRSKLVAILLGPAGMGVNQLLIATLQLVESITSFGISASSVKNVSEAHGSNDHSRVSTIVRILRRCVWATGLLGTTSVLVLSSWLSEVTFGNDEYKFAFIWLSISLLFNQLASGNLVVLQGLRKVYYLAKAKVFGSIAGAVVTIPMYYFWRIDGIVPGIIASSLTAMIISWLFTRRIKFDRVVIPREVLLSESKKILSLGFTVNFSSLMTIGNTYLLKLFISATGGLVSVGLYSAGFSIVTNYVGMIFSAMGTDYYPRLSAVSSDNEKFKEIVFSQIHVAILILLPILCFLVVFVNFGVELLYSKEFLPIVSMIKWASVGMVFRAVSWSLGFILLAKGAAKLLMKVAILGSVCFLINNIVAYHFWGLTGLGAAFIINYIMHLGILLVIVARSFDIVLSKYLYLIIIRSSFICLLVVLVTYIEVTWVKVFMEITLLSGVLLYTLLEFNKKINIRELLKNRLKF